MLYDNCLTTILTVRLQGSIALIFLSTRLFQRKNTCQPYGIIILKSHQSFAVESWFLEYKNIFALLHLLVEINWVVKKVDGNLHKNLGSFLLVLLSGKFIRKNNLLWKTKLLWSVYVTYNLKTLSISGGLQPLGRLPTWHCRLLKEMSINFLTRETDQQQLL